MRKVAVIVAVEYYIDIRIPRVVYASADANDLSSALLLHGFNQDDRLLLIDSKATKTTVQSRIRKLLAILESDDVFYFYYAGHGFAQNSKNYITCVDTDIDDLTRTSIKVDWLFENYKLSKCNRIVMFLDACESGMLAKADMRGIFTDLTEDELSAFFKEVEHCVCFSSCKPGESSYPSVSLKHGIWTYHLIQAIMANAPSAIEGGHIVTSSSLQNYLSKEVPKTLRATFAGTRVQNPMAFGSLNRDFVVADVLSIIQKRASAAKPGIKQLGRVKFFRDRYLPVKKLSGFKKTHRVPDNVSIATEAFVSRISTEEISNDLEGIRNTLRNEFDFKRKDLQVDQSEGIGSIITPYFDYEVIIYLNPDDPSEVILRRQVHNIRKPEKIMSDEFENVFSGMFDTLEFTAPNEVDIGSVVDMIEELDDDAITVDYDANLNWCEVSLEEVNAAIRFKDESISIEYSRPVSPAKLVESFNKAQKTLVNEFKMKQLPFNEKKRLKAPKRKLTDY